MSSAEMEEMQVQILYTLIDGSSVSGLSEKSPVG